MRYKQKLLYRFILNFLAFGTFSPAKIRSAPTFLPLLGQPYFGPNTLFHILQEEASKTITRQVIVRRREDTVFIYIGFYGLNVIKAKNIIWRLQVPGILLRFLVPEPVGISQIIFSYPVDFVMDKILGNIFNFFCRHPSINTSGLHLGRLQHDGSGSNN